MFNVLSQSLHPIRGGARRDGKMALGNDMFDPRLQQPFSMVVAGPSNTGKTYFVKTVIENMIVYFQKKLTI